MLEFVWHIAPAILTLIGGGLLLNWYFAGRANLGALVERICDCLDQLRDDCGVYWSDNCETDNPASNRILETKIKSGVCQIAALIGLVAEKRPPFSSQTRTLLADLNDACTGGDFESVGRKRDVKRLMRIVSTCGKISVELQRLKIWPIGLEFYLPGGSDRPEKGRHPIV
jgi:hypothetical protein